MIKISPNLGGGLGNGYKIFELFYLENRFLYFIVKTFFNLKFFVTTKTTTCLFLLKLSKLN